MQSTDKYFKKKKYSNLVSADNPTGALIKPVDYIQPNGYPDDPGNTILPPGLGGPVTQPVVQQPIQTTVTPDPGDNPVPHFLVLPISDPLATAILPTDSTPVATSVPVDTGSMAVGTGGGGGGGASGTTQPEKKSFNWWWLAALLAAFAIYKNSKATA